MSAPLDGLVRGALLLVCALAILPALRRQSAALRHLVLTVALAGAALAPVAGLVVPAWHVPVPVVSMWPARWVAASVNTGLPSAISRAALPAIAPQASASAAVAHVVTRIWLAGVAVSLLILGAGLLRLRWLVRRGRPLTDGVWAEQAALLAQDGPSRALRCVETTHPRLLATSGLVRPTLLVPRAARAWSAERVSLVLAHELAHVRRADWLIQIAAQIVRAGHWFNPVAWIVCARLRREAEQACDDVVLARGTAGGTYAAELVAIVRELRGAPSRVPAMPVVHQSGFERRVACMLTPTLNRRPVSRTTALAVATVGLAVLLPLVAVAAQAVRTRVEGSVTDPQRGVLPGVKLTLTHMVNGLKTDIESDSGGRFVFGDLEPGDYLLEARLPGFAVYRTTATVSGDGRAIAQELTLQIGTIQETISVREAATGPRQTRTQVVDQEQFRRLEEARRKRAAQVCWSAPERPVSFVGGNVRAPHKFVDVRPSYPEHLRTAGVSGTVALAARIGIDGLVEDIRVVSATDPAFASAATEAVSRWEFDATLLNCVPMPVDVSVTVSFDLER
jgi:TonB family protein